MIMMDLENLRKKYLGKKVRTERPATPEETECWGGEGVVRDIYEENGLPWILMDWGMAWVLTPNTRITLLGGAS